jgi:hypothetical protein
MTTRAARPHDWSFVAAATEGSTATAPLLIAVCRTCGLIRTKQVDIAGQEGRINVQGDCPGAHDPAMQS